MSGVAELKTKLLKSLHIHIIQSKVVYTFGLKVLTKINFFYRKNGKFFLFCSKKK